MNGSLRGAGKPKMRLRLYVAGSAPNSRAALANLHALGERGSLSDYELDVIDVLEVPSAAVQDRVIVTPTLIRIEPAPVRRIVGDLSDHGSVLSVLEAG